jgi:hypothetical protein
MFPGLKTESLTIARLFSDPNMFAVPAYQRNYSWTTKEVGQLLEDISAAAGIEGEQAASPDYFLGTVLLLDPGSEANRDRAAAVFDVVDGQQRLVTLALLVSVLEQSLDDDAPVKQRLRSMLEVAGAGGGRILLSVEEQPYFDNLMVAARSEPPLDDDDDDNSDVAINTAYRYLEQELSALSQADRLGLAKYIVDWCHVVVIITRDIDRAHLLFTVLNGRGRPLQRKDILKAEVLQAVAPDQSGDALARWEAASGKLGNDFEGLFSHIRTIHSSGRPQIISAVRALVRQTGCQAFLADVLTPLADAFYLVRRFPELPKRSAEHPELAAALTSLNRFGNADWVPPALLAMRRFNDDPQFATRVVVDIDRLMFLLKLLALGGPRRARRINQVISAISSGVAHELDAAFAITREEARAVHHHLKDIHRRNSGLAKLILMRIEDELGGTPLLLSTTELNLEHVLPQRPSASSEWRRIFPDPERREACINSLGNLALVPPQVNSKLKNMEFAGKHAIFTALRTTQTPLMRTNEDIIDAPAWTEEYVMAREARLLRVLSRLWRLDIGSRAGSTTVAEVLDQGGPSLLA